MHDIGSELAGCVTERAEKVEVRLQRQLEQARQNVAELEAAIHILEEQPKLLETLNLLRRVGI